MKLQSKIDLVLNITNVNVIMNVWYILGKLKSKNKSTRKINFQNSIVEIKQIIFKYFSGNWRQN